MMETWDILRTLWFVLVGVLLAGYSILDGFDLGIGSLAPFLVKNEQDKKSLYNAIGPFWDGNEVWLLTGGGALFAAFPHAYATVFSGFYLALMLVLWALILRAVSLEFAAHDTRRKSFWEFAFHLGSVIPALFFGVALGNVVMGVPLDSGMEFSGTFFTLFRPLPLAFGLLGLAAFMLHGSIFAALKTVGDLQTRARSFAQKISVPYALLFGISFGMGAFYLSSELQNPLAWFFSVLAAICWVLQRRALKNAADGRAFFYSAAGFLSLWGIVGAIHFPNLVKASTGGSLSITIFSASSSQLTLTVMLVIALVGMPLVIAYTIYAYKVFKGKVRNDGTGY